MTKANMDIRETAKTCKVALWQIADELGITEWTFIRHLRKELPGAEKEKIFGIIEELKNA